MKREAAMNLSLAAVLLALAFPNLAQAQPQAPAQDTASLQSPPIAAIPSAGDGEAMRMVSALLTGRRRPRCQEDEAGR
jgi:hypothetical protein